MRSWRTRAFAHLLVTAAIAAGSTLAQGCDASEPPPFSADSAFAHVVRQVAFGPRVPGSAAHGAAVKYLAHTLERYGARVSLQPFEIADPYTDGKPLPMINIVGSYATDASRRVLLAAHYDSRPWADQESDTTLWRTPIPAAVDGAAGVGVLLEIARLLGASTPPRVGIDIVLFDGEDYGREGDLSYYLLGSKHFVANLDGYRPDCVILLDMVGGRGTRVRQEGFSVQRAPALVSYMFERAAALGLDYFEPVPDTPVYDDHVPFLQAGIDAIDLFGYGYGAWHTLRDDVEQCDPGALRQVGTLLLDVTYDFRYSRR